MAVIGGNGGLPPHNPNNGNLGGNGYQQALGTLKVKKIQRSNTGGQKLVIPPLTLSISSGIDQAPQSSRGKILRALSPRSKKSSPPVSPRQAAGKIEQAEQTIQLLVEKQKTQMLQNAYDKAMIEKCFQVAFEEAPHLLTQEFATLVVHLGADRLREILDAAHQYQKTEIINFFTNFVTPLLPYGALYSSSEYLTAFQNQPVDDYTAYQQALQLQVDPLLAYAKALQEPVPQQQPDPFYTAYAQALQQPVPQPPAQPTPVVPKKAKPPNPLAAFVGQKKIKSSDLKNLGLTRKQATKAFEQLLLKAYKQGFSNGTDKEIIALGQKLVKNKLLRDETGYEPDKKSVAYLVNFLVALSKGQYADELKRKLLFQDEDDNPYAPYVCHFGETIQWFVDYHYARVVVGDVNQALQNMQDAAAVLSNARGILKHTSTNYLAQHFELCLQNRDYDLALHYLKLGIKPEIFEKTVIAFCKAGRGKELVDAGFKNHFPLTKHGKWDNGIVLPYDPGYFN